jgi:hypothetical protein
LGERGHEIRRIVAIASVIFRCDIARMNILFLVVVVVSLTFPAVLLAQIIMLNTKSEFALFAHLIT